jgi:hypothetical protein
LANASAFLSETFQQFLIGVGEGSGRARKDFEDTGELRVSEVEDGNDEDGADAEMAGDGGIDARIELGINGKLRLTGLKTGAGETVAGVERYAEIWGEVSGGGAADHLIAAGEGEGGGTGVSGFGGAHYEFVEDQIESEIEWETGEEVLLEEAGEVRMRLVRAELGPRHRMREHMLFRQPATKWRKAGSVGSFPRNAGEVNWRRGFVIG